MGVTLQNTITQQLIILLLSPLCMCWILIYWTHQTITVFQIEVTHLSLNSVGIQPMILRQ